MRYNLPITEGDLWSSITSYPGSPVQCPVPGCRGHLVWWEAGFVPGYRVCLRQTAPDKYDPATLLHRFRAVFSADRVTLILDQRYDEPDGHADES